MNKTELREKWSKYCDTDKLVDDVRSLLSYHKHRNTENGVCVLLDTYFEQKEPLIKLFATSKNYIGNMRIAMEKGFERQPDTNELNAFFRNVHTNFQTDKIFKHEDSEGKTIFDYLLTGKTIFDIDQLPEASEQKAKKANVSKFNYENFATKESNEKYKQFNKYMLFFNREASSTIRSDFAIGEAVYKKEIPQLKAGTKTSRAFNKVCAYYGVDKFDGYNKAFAQYADLVSGLVRKMQFVISLNPLDYLTMSNGVSWVSCHNIEYGGCMGGTLSYMLDTTSIITFVVTEIDGDIHNIPKVYRQMYHYENNLFVQNRLYPQGNDGATNLYDKFRKIVIDEFSELLGTSDWVYQVGSSACLSHINSVGAHYPDYRHNRNVSIFYPRNNEPSIRNHKMTIGHEGICVNCGKEYTYSSALAHTNRSDCTR